MSDSNTDNDGFGIWVPAEIVKHPQLTLADKFCFGVISALDKGKGFWMQNDSLATIVGISPTYASTCIKRLKDFGLVTVEQVPGGRRTVVCIDRSALRYGLTVSPLQESVSHPCENHKAPLTNFTRRTNRTRDDKNKDDETQVIDLSGFTWTDSGLFTKAWSEWCRYKGKMNNITVAKQMNFLKANCNGEADAVTIIETSIRNGWKGLFPINRGSGYTPQSHPSKHIDYNNDGLV